MYKNKAISSLKKSITEAFNLVIEVLYAVCSEHPTPISWNTSKGIRTKYINLNCMFLTIVCNTQDCCIT